MTTDPLDGIRFPKPSISIPRHLVDATDDTLRQLSTKVEVRVKERVVPGSRRFQKIKVLLSIVEELGPELVSQVREMLVRSPKEQRKASKEILLRLAKVIEKHLDLIPSWLEFLWWPIVRYGVGRITDNIFDRIEPKLNEVTP